MYHNERSQISFAHLLGDTFKIFDCRNPRDKVFALISILLDNEAAGSLIDYSASVEQVYTVTAHYLIMSSRNLQHLAFISPCRLPDDFGEPQESLKLPSWVPDWKGHSRYRDDDELDLQRCLWTVQSIYPR